MMREKGFKLDEVQVLKIMAIACIAAIATMFFFTPTAFASTEETVKQTMGIVYKLLKFAATVFGVIYIAFGLFKYATSHANENGPEQQKAVGQIVAGLLCILLFDLGLNEATQTALNNLIINATK